MNSKELIPKQSELNNIVFACYKELGGSATNKELDDKVVEKVTEKITAELKRSNLNEEEIKQIVDAVLSEPKENDYRTELEYRIAWTQQALKKVGKLENIQRGVWALKENCISETTDISIDEQVENIDEESISSELKLFDDLANIVKNLDAKDFEHLVGYWLSRRNFFDVKVTGRSGDGGIDGFAKYKINELITINVAFQCKRYNGKVQAGDIRGFFGALINNGEADIGLLVTTGQFSGQKKEKETSDSTSNRKGKIILIDGKDFIDDLIAYDIGISKKVDNEFFEKKFFLMS